jgi:DNA-binding MarR family transcriptional regulator
MPDTDVINALSALSLESFRVTARLNQAADQLSRELGLSSARWQVMGALDMANEALTVAAIARRMGLQRQSVQRTADALVAEGFVEFCSNPAHRRAKLVVLSAPGRAALEALRTRRDAWARALTPQLDLDALQTATATLAHLRELLNKT